MVESPQAMVDKFRADLPLSLESGPVEACGSQPTPRGLRCACRSRSRAAPLKQVFRSRYKDWKIAADEALAVNPKVMTVSKLRQALGGLYTKWMGLALVQDMAFFAANLVVEVAENGEGFTTFIPVKLVRPLHVISGEVAFV